MPQTSIPHFHAVSNALRLSLASSARARPHKLQHQVFLYWFLCLLAHYVFSLKAEQVNSSLNCKENQPKSSYLLSRGSLLQKMPQEEMKVSAWQAGPLPSVSGQQNLAGEVQGEPVARNLLVDVYTHGGNTAEVCAPSGTHISAFM